MTDFEITDEKRAASLKNAVRQLNDLILQAVESDLKIELDSGKCSPAGGKPYPFVAISISRPL